jgi:peptide/nickel transport system substrate-binding protein
VVKVDRVEWLYIPEAVTAVQALGASEVDYLEIVPNDYVPALASDPNISIQSATVCASTI